MLTAKKPIVEEVVIDIIVIIEDFGSSFFVLNCNESCELKAVGTMLVVVLDHLTRS